LGHNTDDWSQAPDDNSTMDSVSSCTAAGALHSDAGRDSTESLDEMQRNAKDGDGDELLMADVVAAGL